MEMKNLKLKINLQYLFLFGASASIYPFLTIYFQDRGLSFTQIGILLALNSIVGVASQPVWGFLTDKYLNKRVSLSLMLAVSAVLAFVFVFVRGIYPILFILIVFMCFLSPIFSVNDAFCYDIIDKRKDLQYGKIRLMGSIGYAVISLVLGWVIKISNINSSFFSYFIFATLALLILRSMKYKDHNSQGSLDFRDVVSILKNKRFILICLSAMVINAALGANGNYISVLIQKTGGDVSNIGMLWFLLAMSELPLFFYGKSILKRIGVLNAYLLSLGLYFFRYMGDAMAVSYQMVLIIQILQGITFPFFLMSTLEYVNSIVPEKARTTALTVFTAFAGGIGGVVGNMGGGYLIQTRSVFFLFRVMAFVAVAALMIGLVLKAFDKRLSKA